MKVRITSMDLDRKWYIRDPRPRGETHVLMLIDIFKSVRSPCPYE